MDEFQLKEIVKYDTLSIYPETLLKSSYIWRNLQEGVSTFSEFSVVLNNISDKEHPLFLENFSYPEISS